MSKINTISTVAIMDNLEAKEDDYYKVSNIEAEDIKEVLVT